MAIILDGKKVRDEIAADLRARIFAETKAGKSMPVLAIIQIGENKESEAYIKNKKKFAHDVGAEVRHVQLPADISEEDLVGEINKLNNDKSVHGVIAQMPFSKHLDKEKIIESIAPEKDVDGLTSASIKGLWIGSSKTFMPATTRGVMTLLKHYGLSVAGKHAVVIGRSTLVGKPTAIALTNADATVTLCHSGTKNLEFHTLAADIIVTATGRPRLITEYHVKPEHIVIDVGVTIEDIPERRAVGDVDFDEVSNIVHAISPVPGGAGPMTVASLFQNLFDAYQNSAHN
jgi:methylenetetrahydrofolate dehydrogenase (NADP+)/methenyltetrahydrofolate cyclohydrolase